MKASIYDMTLEQLTQWLADHGQKKFRSKQIWNWLYQNRVSTFEDMHNLPTDLIAVLTEYFTFSPLKPLITQEASDGTTKYLFQLEDGLMIETVMMRMEYGLSVCVTSQVGCNIGCTFCASGLLSKQRDLTAGEIVAQIMQVQHYLDNQGKDERVGHVVVMGIGEPFDNFDNVMNFIDIIKDQRGLAIGARHITVSTSGLADKVRAFADRQTQINLAISLHAPNDALRNRIMRINRKWPLDELFDAIQYYIDTTNRRVTFEYIMLSDVNDHVQEAKELVELLRPIKKLAYVNIIPYNPVQEHPQYERSSKNAISRFYDTLMQGGINCVVRKEHGTDIDAACGQLRSKQLKA